MALYCTKCDRQIHDFGYTVTPVETIHAQLDHHDLQHKGYGKYAQELDLYGPEARDKFDHK